MPGAHVPTTLTMSTWPDPIRSFARRTSLRQTSGSTDGMPSETASVGWLSICVRRVAIAACSRFSTGRMFGRACAGIAMERTVLYVSTSKPMREYASTHLLFSSGPAAMPIGEFRW